MSADNWDTCPRCRQKELDRLGGLSQRVSEGYGELPLDEFDALRAELAKGPEYKQTFREDYEFYGAEEGTIEVSYSGHCTVCDLDCSFKESHPFWRPGRDRP
jgi:hypothetical protein